MIRRRTAFIGVILTSLLLLTLFWDGRASQYFKTPRATKKKSTSVNSNIHYDTVAESLYNKDGYLRENATLFTLCRNNDLQTLVETILSWEDRFNHRYHYDWVFINDEPYTEKFKNITSRLISGRAYYGTIPKDEWGVPSWINNDEFTKGKNHMESLGVKYAQNDAYRSMCRYNSGLFYNHPLMQKYKYYWRVDGDTHMFCDVEVDVFKYMRENDLKYAFTLSMYENMNTIPSLWEMTLKFFKKFPQYVAKDNLARFITDNNGFEYNGCHFWSNFEIADADFWRSEAYTSYFTYLDWVGGFYYERWGDAPVHSLAASIMLPKDKIAHLDFIGYWHPPLTHMPSNYLSREHLRCGMNPERNFEWDDKYNCIEHFYIAQDMENALPAKMQANLS